MAFLCAFWFVSVELFVVFCCFLGDGGILLFWFMILLFVFLFFFNFKLNFLGGGHVLCGFFSFLFNVFFLILM